MNLTTTGPVTVWVYLSPRNNVHPTDGLTYAVSLDGGPPQRVNVTTATGADDTSMNKQWERNTSDNVNRTATTFDVARAGEHTLRVWQVDPTVVVQRHARERDEVGRRRSRSRPVRLVRSGRDRRLRQEDRQVRARAHAGLAQPAARLGGRAGSGGAARCGQGPHQDRGRPVPRQDPRVGRRQRGVQRGRHAQADGVPGEARRPLHRRRVPLGTRGGPEGQAVPQRLQRRGPQPEERRDLRAREVRGGGTACRSTASACKATTR